MPWKMTCINVLHFQHFCNSRSTSASRSSTVYPASRERKRQRARERKKQRERKRAIEREGERGGGRERECEGEREQFKRDNSYSTLCTLHFVPERNGQTFWARRYSQLTIRLRVAEMTFFLILSRKFYWQSLFQLSARNMWKLRALIQCHVIYKPWSGYHSREHITIIFMKENAISKSPHFPMMSYW